jgi:predicted phosphodiesterase
MTRIAVLSDIHGNLPALEAVIADAEALGCDTFLNLGDSLSGPLWPVETADLLIARDWPTIAGNHERQLLGDRARMGASDAFTRDVLDERHLAWIRSLPATLVVGDLLLTHGTPASDLVHFLYTVEGNGIREATIVEVEERAGDAPQPIILCGHTHLVRSLVLADGRTILNPGSVGLQAFDDDHPQPYRVEVGDPLARYVVLDGDGVQLRQVEYDWHGAADRAAANGRPDWEIGLRTGRM